jgi:hypothetical protein
MRRKNAERILPASFRTVAHPVLAEVMVDKFNAGLNCRISRLHQGRLSTPFALGSDLDEMLCVRCR